MKKILFIAIAILSIAFMSFVYADVLNIGDALPKADSNRIGTWFPIACQFLTACGDHSDRDSRHASGASPRTGSRFATAHHTGHLLK